MLSASLNRFVPPAAEAAREAGAAVRGTAQGAVPAPPGGEAHRPPPPRALDGLQRSPGAPRHQGVAAQEVST